MRRTLLVDHEDHLALPPLGRLMMMHGAGWRYEVEGRVGFPDKCIHSSQWRLKSCVALFSTVEREGHSAIMRLCRFSKGIVFSSTIWDRYTNAFEDESKAQQ